MQTGRKCVTVAYSGGEDGQTCVELQRNIKGFWVPDCPGNDDRNKATATSSEHFLAICCSGFGWRHHIPRHLYLFTANWFASAMTFRLFLVSVKCSEKHRCWILMRAAACKGVGWERSWAAVYLLLMLLFSSPWADPSGAMSCVCIPWCGSSPPLLRNPHYLFF